MKLIHLLHSSWRKELFEIEIKLCLTELIILIFFFEQNRFF